MHVFNRTRSSRIATALAAVLPLAGCGLVSESGSGDERTIVVGTTSAPSVLDPAGAWDGSWELYRNVYQTLLYYPSGSTSPQPDAAEKCEFTDTSSRTYRCTLKEGLKFSNGNALDAKAVKASIDRIMTVAENGVKTGPAGLLGSLDKVTTSGDLTVTFHLNKADTTFPFVLGSPATSLVDPEQYPADSLREGNSIIGSGPYLLESYEKGAKSVLVKNPGYKGAADLENNGVTIRYFTDSTKMVSALEDKDIDLILRGLTAEEIVELDSKGAKTEKKLALIEGTGAEIRYLVFNPKDARANNPAVRKSVAQIIDRDVIAREVYQGTVEPLYSMVPAGVAGHTTDFFDIFGDPDTQKAAEILSDAGITAPVKLTLWYTTDRYGSSMATEFKEIKRQLDASGLFKITLKSSPWADYQQSYQKGRFPVFGRGWFPDFPDPDNFIAPFVGEQNALGTPYDVPEITDTLLPTSRKEADRGAVTKQFARAQEIIAEDARLIPIWQGKQYIAASQDIAGIENSLDPSTIMQMWHLHRKTSW
ncbi:ABC transporter substrate-binding protein [Streptomyces sp. GC420]|uniref:ABC transporter substrate-binding protein n=1 Tax=Streptomyces sp. GC420 TaxID=2697568 RepID=UPI001DCE4A6C|nr:ABC transporter substrate-binding protein [Streptomyces sp. GC420]NBM16422.1 peptide-binding protein [Streptomyces sp. GC420]